MYSIYVYNNIIEPLYNVVYIPTFPLSFILYLKNCLKLKYNSGNTE